MTHPQSGDRKFPARTTGADHPEPASSPGTALSRHHDRTVRELERATGTFATSAMSRMEERLPWYRTLSAEERSWVGLIIQAGIAAFINWYRAPGQGPAVPIDVFGTAPRELTRAITLEQTVALVRVAIETVETEIDDVISQDGVAEVREAMMRYSREIAFAAAEVYARAAEARGAWDARLEALIVDSVLRGEADEAIRSRAAALGWTSQSGVVVVVGHTPNADPESVLDAIRRAARGVGCDVLTGVQGDRLVVVLGGTNDPPAAAGAVASQFGPGAVVVGPLVPDLLAAAGSARAAIAGLRAAPGWPDAPRPVTAERLLAERALSGDGHARRTLVADVYGPLAEAGPVILETLAAFLEHGGSVEATARMLFVHSNTVRYRLRRATDLTGLSPYEPRDAYTLRIALTLGRLLGATRH